MEIPPHDLKFKDFGIMDFPFFENISDPLFANTTSIITTSVYDNMERVTGTNTPVVYQNSTDYLEWSNDLKLALTNVKTLTGIQESNNEEGNVKFNEENVDSNNIMESEGRNEKFVNSDDDTNKLIRTKITTRKRKANLSVEISQRKIPYFERGDNDVEEQQPQQQRGISVKNHLELATGENNTAGLIDNVRKNGHETKKPTAENSSK